MLQVTCYVLHFMIDFQSLFYALGSLFLIIWIFVLLLFAVILWKTYTFIKKAPEEIKEKIMNMIPGHKKEVAGLIGLGLSTVVLNKIEGVFRKREEQE